MWPLVKDADFQMEETGVPAQAEQPKPLPEALETQSVPSCRTYSSPVSFQLSAGLQGCAPALHLEDSSQWDFLHPGAGGHPQGFPGTHICQPQHGGALDGRYTQELLPVLVFILQVFLQSCNSPCAVSTGIEGKYMNTKKHPLA